MSIQLQWKLPGKINQKKSLNYLVIFFFITIFTRLNQNNMYNIINILDNITILSTNSDEELISKVRKIAIENCDDDMNIDNVDDAINYINEYSSNLEILF